jgi:hypothetical protein
MVEWGMVEKGEWVEKGKWVEMGKWVPFRPVFANW